MNTETAAIVESLDEVSTARKAIAELPARQFFSSTNLEAASETISAVVNLCDTAKLKYAYNFDINAEMPAGYGIGIIVNSERVPERGNVVTDILIAAVPEPETVAADTAGAEWSRNAIVSALMAKLASTSRAMKRAGSGIAKLPLTVTEFITSNRGGSSDGMGTFNAIAGMYVKGLKKKGLDYMSKALLRSVLQSREFAETQFPRVPQTAWESLLDAMIARAEAGVEIDKVLTKLNPAILVHWKETRDSAEMPEIDTDFSDIAGLE